ncbi:MAG: metal-sensitive transcriptional regulator [Candidatus Gastranaerophilales bacterium]|nr:metal-sensitive transcriptional regulator [Candidatus Gastranaerophilales bacterium]
MTLCGTDDDKKKLIVRLNRIEGQVRGLSKMITEDRDCMEVLNQVVSVQSAIKGVWKEVVKDHLQGCVSTAMKDGKNSKELIDELVNHIEKLR